MQRDTTISICKAIGIILMVIGHANCPLMLGRFLYEFHMPLFFMAAGYFFSLKYLDNEAEFIKKRIKGLYFPFLKWALFFLAIHNLMFDLGILNEQYGNGGGGVTHPYSFHQMQQNIWNMVTAMGGYDPFLAGAFWFFRGLFVASITYLLVFKLYGHLAGSHFDKWKATRIPVAICITMLIIAAWKTGEGLKVINLVQGGYREIMGTFFFGCGFLFKQWKAKYKVRLSFTLLFFTITALFAYFNPASMDWKSPFEKFLALLIPAICGFLMTYNISTWIDKSDGAIKRFLVFCGNNTLNIFIFHIVAFKLVSLIKIWYYDLEFAQIGCHMVIHDYSKDDLFWIPYSVAGVGLPLLATYLYRKMALPGKPTQA